MRKSILWLALAGLVSALPAAAQEIIVPGTMESQPPTTRNLPTTTKYEPVPSPWYVGGEFGAMIVEDMNIDVGATNNAITINHDYGYDGGIFVGYDFGAFRLEAEAAYKKADIEDYQTTIRLPLEGPLFAAGRDGSGSSSALSFMINGMLDFGDDDGISGFVGGGVGIARVKANNYRNFANATPFLDGSDSKLAWQVFAGVRQRVRDNIDVTVKYRFFNAGKVDLLAFNGAETRHRFRSHSLLGGITFRFGGTKPIEVCQSNGEPITAANPCIETVCEEGWSLNRDTGQCERTPNVTVVVCPPDETRHPRGYVCPTGPYIVFFDWDRPDPDDPRRDELSAQAKMVLDHAVARYDHTGSVQVSIEAHTDTSGKPGYNVGLSELRLATVQAYLVEKGIPSGVINPRPFGERCPLVDSGDNVREPQNRRVEIWYGDRRIDPGACPPPPGRPAY